MLLDSQRQLKKTWHGHNENGLSGGEEASGHEERVNRQPIGKADLQGRAPGGSDKELSHGYF